MTTGEKMGKLKPVFPALYLIVFVHTVCAMFLSYINGPPPSIILGVVGESNKVVMLFITYTFAFLLCVYDIIYYARLEIFEHNARLNFSIKSTTVFFEFVIRFLLVGIVALKLIKYEALDDLFVFTACVCFFISIWLFYLKLFRIEHVGRKDFLPNLIVFLLSLVAVNYSSAPELLAQNAILVIVLSTVMAIFLTGGVFCLVMSFGKELYALSKDFITNWDGKSINQKEGA